MAIMWNNNGLSFFTLNLSRNKSFGFNFFKIYKFIQFRKH